jgi:hydrogenase maturation protease
MTTGKPIRVLGIGNVLMGDDGLGPYVVRVLDARYQFPDHVEIIDAGTPGLDFTPYLADAGAVIVVDTVTSDAPPGTLRRYDMAQLLATPPPARINPHQPGLREALMAAELTGTTPEHLAVIGVVPGTVETGTRLGQAVRDAIPEVIAAILGELDSLGVSASEREQPRDPDIWWE